MRKNIVYLNGKFLLEEEAKISVFSGGVLYGEGLFETMRADNGQVFRLDEHLLRLKQGAKVLGLKVPEEIRKSEKIIRELTERNNLSDAYLRLNLISFARHFTALAGSPTDPHRFDSLLRSKTNQSGEESQLIFFCRNIKDYLKKKSWTCVIVQKVRQNEYSPLSRIKSLNYLLMLLARKEAESKGADEGILLNTKGEICEGSRTNIFVITENGVLNTPPIECGCLPGITRKAVIELIKSGALARGNSVTLNAVKGLKKLEVREERIKIEDLKKAKEIFLTNSLIGVMPARFAARRVTKIDGKIVGQGKIGPWTKKIQSTYVSTAF